MIRILFFLFICLSISSCGFKPMYKSDSIGIGLEKLAINFKNDVAYEIKEELKNLFSTEKENFDYMVTVQVNQELTPVITNENGTVSKYQIDITLFFEVSNKFGEVVINDVAVGVAQYDVLVSEIENKDLSKQMLRSATNDAASLMITKIQSKLSLTNDN